MKKLKLKKETISKLNDEGLKQINGGGIYLSEGTCWCLPDPEPVDVSHRVQCGY